MMFGKALDMLFAGKAITRSDWYGSAAKPVVKLQVPDKHSKMTKPYLYMEKLADGKIERFPLDLSCESLLSDKWVVAK